MNFRLTKYDPNNRNAEGHYIVDEWTSVSQIGRDYNGVVLTAEEYLRIESAHVRALLSFCEACGLAEMAVQGFEPHGAPHEYPGIPRAAHDLALHEGLSIPTASLDPVIRSILREDFWCRLIGKDGSYIHFGYDYYTYVGSPTLPDASFMHEPSLFIEPFESPYGQQADDEGEDAPDIPERFVKG